MKNYPLTATGKFYLGLFPKIHPIIELLFGRASYKRKRASQGQKYTTPGYFKTACL